MRLQQPVYEFQTKRGTFRIQPFVSTDGGLMWRVMYGDENLGSYSMAQQAVDDLAGGYTFEPSCGDTSELGIPDDLGDWSVVR
jgi:hypothetical protein